MDWRREWKPLAWMLAVFLAAFYLPAGTARFDHAVMESLQLLKWYAREHVLLCLVPAFFIAGGIAQFVSQASVMRYLGAGANKALAYGVAAVSGTVLAVCSCTVLPLFAGIHTMGAGLGPASAFLYSGPAINVLAIILTARVLGLPIGVARAVGAVAFSVVIGLLMHLLFRREERERARRQAQLPAPPAGRPLRRTVLYFATMIGILVFANWSRADEAGALWRAVHAAKWWLTGALAAALGVMLTAWFGLSRRRLLIAAAPTVLAAVVAHGHPLMVFGVGVVALSAALATEKGEAGAWFGASWGFAKQILPLLLGGILVSGVLLGRPGEEGLIPSRWIAGAVGGNGIGANLFAAVAGALMYFATLTEVPILQGLIGSGMGQGPALTLLLAGPALSLPSMLVIRTVLGTRKMLAFVGLVVVMATLTGLLYGMIAP